MFIDKKRGPFSIQAGPCPSPHGRCPPPPVIVRIFLPKPAVATDAMVEHLASQLFYISLTSDSQA